MDELDDTRTVEERFLDTDGGGAIDSAVVAPGDDVLDRYTILDEVGAGGMGVVYAAYDRTLDRKVAIKLLRTKGGGRVADGQRRMLHEAQALARLSHPNVVTVFDVGTYRGRVYIAMEFIEGVTLDAWVRGEQPTCREVLSVLLEAGRGLAASHAAGLVHRDFKPANVLVGGIDGERVVRVVDFGLAQTTTAPAESVDLRESVERSGNRTSANLTETGAVMGTPAYMAPEQHLGEPVDAQSDQFSFCVTAYRMLYGEKPFAGRSLKRMRRAVLAGEVRPAPADTKVPTAIRRVLLRGLSVRPSRRFASMRALTLALQRAGARRSRVALALGVAAIVATGAVGAWLGGGDEGPRCEDAAQRLAGVWDRRRQQEIGEAFARSRLRYAADAQARVTARLDTYAEDWARTWAQVCEQGQTDVATLDARMACLRDRLSQLDALAEELTSADDAVIERATQAASDLPPVASCAVVEPGPKAWPVAEADRAEVERVRALIAAADGAYAAGRFERCEELTAEAIAVAETLGHRPLVVAAQWRHGLARTQLGALDLGVEELVEASYEAIELGRDELIARTTMRTAFTIGYRQARYDEAMRWARHGQAAVDRLGDEGELRADILEALGALWMGQADYAQARVAFERALKLRQALYGDGHDKTATMHNNLGSALLGLRLYDRASEHLERSIEIWEQVHGPRHPHVASSLNGLAISYEGLGDLEASRRAHVRAIEIKEEVLGPEHDSLAVSLDNLGSVLVMLGEYAQARRSSLRALKIRERNLGPDHPHVASSLVNIGLADEHEGRLEEATAAQQRALRIFELHFGAEHPFLAFPLTSLGRIDLAQGHPNAAIEKLTRALALREHPASDAERGETRFALGRAIVAAGRADEGRALVEHARREIAGDPTAKRLASEIDAWLAAP